MFALARQTDLATHVVFHCLFSKSQARLRASCVPWEAMVLPAPNTRQSPTTFGNALLAALVHFRIGEVLQPLPTSGRNGFGGADVPLCMRRFLRRAPRLGCGRVRLTSEKRVETCRRCRPPATSDAKARWGGGLGPWQRTSQPVGDCVLSAFFWRVVVLSLSRGANLAGVGVGDSFSFARTVVHQVIKS